MAIITVTAQNGKCNGPTPSMWCSVGREDLPQRQCSESGSAEMEAREAAVQAAASGGVGPGGQAADRERRVTASNAWRRANTPAS